MNKKVKRMINAIRKFSLLLISSCLAQLGQSQDTLHLKEFLANIKKPEIYRHNLKLDNLYDYKREEYNDPEVKKRFLEILGNKWNEEELNAWAEEDIQSGFDQIERETIAKRIADKGKMNYKKAFDSLTNQRKEIVKKSMLDWKVDPIIIFFAGWLEMQEAVPILKEALNDSKHYDTWPVKLALGRLRVEPYYSDILKKYSSIPKKYKYDQTAASDFSDNEEVLIYLATQESIYALSKWLYRKEMVKPFSDDDYRVSIATYPVDTYILLINNESFKKRFPNTRMVNEITKEDIEFCKKWFKENKGKLEFDRYRVRFR